MGRSLVLSFLILSAIFYTMGRPQDDTGKIDYIHSVKNHDFSTRAVEKRFFNALSPEPLQDKIEKKTASRTQAQFLPLSKQTPDNASLVATPLKKPGKPNKFFQLPTYLPLKEMVESTITYQDIASKGSLAQNKKPSIKVARIVPQKSENGLMDFMPLEHVYTPAKTQTPLKIIEKSATTKTIKTVSLPKNEKISPQQKMRMASIPQNPATLMALPVKRAALPQKQKIFPPAKKITVAAIQQNTATLMALPVKRAALPQKQKISPPTKKIIVAAIPQNAATLTTLPVKRTVHSKKNTSSQDKTLATKDRKKAVVASLKNQNLMQRRMLRKKDAAKKWRRLRSKKARLLQARQYALKHKRTRSLMRQLQTKLARRKMRKQRRTRVAALTGISKKHSATHPRPSHMKKLLSRKTKKAFQGNLRRKKISYRNRMAMRRKLRLQHQKAKKRRDRKIARLSVKTNKYARQARLKRAISRRNNKAFQNRIRKQRRSAQSRSRNKRILRTIDKKLGQKRFRKQRIAALKQKKRKKRFVRQRLRRRTARSMIRRKTVKKYRIVRRVRRTRVARRRTVRQSWNTFNFDGTMGAD